MQEIQPRRSWVRRHPILTGILGLGGALLLCIVFGSIVPHIRDIQSSQAKTPQDLATAASLYGHDIEVNGDINDVVTIEETLPFQTGNDIYRQDVEEDCFRLQRAFWQRYPGMKELDVAVYGPAINQSTQQSADLYFGSCKMSHINGVNQQWQSNYQNTWFIYDEHDIASIIAS